MIRPKKWENRVKLVKTIIYFIKNKKGDRVKIGITRNIKFRLATLQSANYEELELIGYIYGGLILEKQLHDKFKKYNVRNEWYKLNKTVKKEINILLGIEKEKKNNRRCKICGYLLSESNLKEQCRHHEYRSVW